MKLLFNGKPAKAVGIRLKPEKTQVATQEWKLTDADERVGVDETRVVADDHMISVTFMNNDKVLRFDVYPIHSVIGYTVTRVS